MKLTGQFPVGRGDGPINVAVQRPTVNLKEAQNAMIQAQTAVKQDQAPLFSKHGRFGPRVITHPGIEQ